MRKFIIPLMMLFVFAGLATAVNEITLDPYSILVNNSYRSNSTVQQYFNHSGNGTSTYICKLYSNENASNGIGTFSEKETLSSVSNSSVTKNYTFSRRSSIADISGTRYTWAVFCNSTANAIGFTGGCTPSTAAAGGWNGTCNGTAFRNYSVDISNPSITVDYTVGSLVGESAEWITNSTGVKFGLTTTDSNADQCELFTNYNVTSNSTSLPAANYSVQLVSYTNNTAFNFSRVNGTGTTWADNSTGYKYSFICNDSAGNQAYTNGSFKVDATAPGRFIFNTSLWKTNSRTLTNNTSATDFKPQIGWNLSTESNFFFYEIVYYDSVYGNSTNFKMNVTTRTQLSANLSVYLAGDRPYFINITAYDKAYNKRQMTVINYKYTTSSTNRVLKAGWNIIGNVGTAWNLSDLRIWSGATTTSFWNSTHQFQSHVSGGSFGATSVPAGRPALLFLSSEINFTDIILDTTAFGLKENLTNQTNNGTSSDYNLVMNRNRTQDFDLQSLDSHLNKAGLLAPQNDTNLNISLFSLYNNTAVTGSKYIPFVANWSINNNTVIKFGQVIWLFANDGALDAIHKPGYALNNSQFEATQELDWGKIDVS